MYDRDDSAPVLLSFLIGGILGASIACLLAPQSGIALRRRIRSRVEGGARSIRRGTRDAAEAGRAFAGAASEVLIGENASPGAAREEAAGAARRRGGVPDPGLPTDTGRSGRG